MGFFSSTVSANLSGRTVGASLLAHMDFRETPRRWWMGFGTLRAGGHDWHGIGNFISIDGLAQPMGTNAPKTTFTLSGVDSTVIQMARQASDRVKGQRCTVFIQFFDITPDDSGAQPWTPLDAPYAISSLTMDQMTYKADGPTDRSVSLTAESLWVNRKRPPYGLLTDRDQNSRFPGDRGMEQLADLVNKTARWPVF